MAHTLAPAPAPTMATSSSVRSLDTIDLGSEFAEENATYWRGKSVLVTGGTGTIGSRLVHWLHKCGANPIRVVSNDENALFDMKNAYGGATNLRWLYGDVRERDRMEAAMQGVEYVFHAAALKHVPLCEYNPTEAVKTNVIGTNNVLEAAAKAGVRQLVFVSTDKAVGPTSTMGASKLLAERIVRGMDGIGDISTAVVRFGNVLGSRGSLVPEIYRQVRELRRANVTDNDMTRFFMSIDLAVQLVLYASIVSLRSGGNLFVLKMPCLRIRDIIEVLRDHFCKLEGIDPAEVPIYEVGKRPGEKLHEELITLEESERTREYGPFLVTYSPDQLASGTAKGNVVAPETMAQFNSSTAVPLTKPEIFSLLRDQAKLI